MEPKSGDYVVIEREGKDIEGALMPSRDDKFLVVKLDNGYNIGLKKRSIKSIKTIKKQTKKKTEIKAPKLNKKLPKIVIIHTGGTIASKVDYETGGVVASIEPKELITAIPELAEIANIGATIVANILSENIDFSHYNLIAKEIEKQISKGAQGIIITHGTDTMHYTSAALSFMLEDLPIPVILTGSQRSSDRGSTDSTLNLLSGVRFMTNTDFSGVAICMHEDQSDESCIILEGTKARKMHASRRDAFRPINTIPIARVSCKDKKIVMMRDDYPKRSDSKLKLKLFKENIKVGLIKTYPNITPDQIKCFKGFEGLVIEGTGMGHVPLTTIGEEIKKLAKTTVIAMSSQAFYGRVQMNVYSTGREEMSFGIIGNLCDMTPETAYIKLSWLLSNYPKEKAKELFEKNLRGEISERSLNEAFLN